MACSCQDKNGEPLQMCGTELCQHNHGMNGHTLYGMYKKFVDADEEEKE